MKQRIVVVGGVAAGASAAAKARRMNEDVEIVLLEKGPYVSYGNCGIPYYIGGTIPEREHLFLVTPETFRDRFAIDVRVKHEVTAIDRQHSTVDVQGPEGPYQLVYDRLILATGGVPLRPPIPGIDLPGVHSLWTVPDGDAIMDRMAEVPVPGPTAVIGGGFIGLEMAEGLRQRGYDVTIIEKMPQIMPPFDEDVAKYGVKHLREQGVNVVLGDGVQSFVEENGKLVGVSLESGTVIPASLAILSIGVRPETALAEQAGLLMGTTRGLKVDSQMRTSDPKIFAAGDMVESTHRITGNPIRLPLAGPANRQGRAAGTNAALDLRPDSATKWYAEFPGVLGTSVVKIFDMTMAQTGYSEKAARLAGLDILVSHTFSTDHAGYYPGAKPMLIKLVIGEANGRLLGAQIVGYAGVDKRIDVLAVSAAAGLRAFDLEQLELAYAPPYGSAKDPVNIAGMAAANLLRGDYKIVGQNEWQEWENVFLLDVRNQAEWAAGHIDGAHHLPIDGLRAGLDTIPKDRPIVVYCAIGQRAYTACRIMMQNGFSSVYSLSGGYQLAVTNLADDEYNLEQNSQN